MTLRELLEQKKDRIIDQWLDAMLSTYPVEAGVFYKQQKNEFSNPVGNIFAIGAKAIVEYLMAKSNVEQLCQHLDDIIAVRAVQDFSPSQAVSFIFSLKKVIEGAVRDDLSDPRILNEFVAFEAEIDQLMLFAFDIFVRRREKIYELRVDEIKRSISTIIKEKHRSSSEREPSELCEERETRSR
jgi:hypothetical protein